MEVLLRRMPSASNQSVLGEGDQVKARELLFGSKYSRKGVTITRLKVPRPDRLTKYKTMVVPPTQGWYPSSMANFIFGYNVNGPQWYRRLVPSHFNPSVWKSLRHRDCPVLRVPKDRAKETWEILYQKGFWYNGARNLWYRRKRPVASGAAA